MSLPEPFSYWNGNPRDRLLDYDLGKNLRHGLEETTLLSMAGTVSPLPLVETTLVLTTARTYFAARLRYMHRAAQNPTANRTDHHYGMVRWLSSPPMFVDILFCF